MSLVAPRSALSPRALEADGSGPRALVPFNAPALLQPVGRRRHAAPRLHRLLDAFWVGSMLLVAILTAAGLSTALLGPLAHADAGKLYDLGEIVDFRKGGDAPDYLRQGWASASAQGTRTAGAVADLAFPAHLSNKSALWLRVEATPVFALRDDAFWVDVLANGTHTGRYQLRKGQGSTSFVTLLPYEPSAHAEPLHVTFVVGADHTEDRREASALQVENLSLN